MVERRRPSGQTNRGPVAIVIPARYASTRLPGKPLLEAKGKLLIQYAWERARQCEVASTVIIATDDARIFDAAQRFGAT